MTKKPEQFSVVKFFKGFTNPITWSKGLIYLVMGLVILFVVFSILGRGSNVHRPYLIALPGSTVMNPDMSSTQEMNKKRVWWMPSPFVEVFSQSDTRDRDLGFGIRFGGRWDF